MTVEGKGIPKGVYTSAEPWISGRGFVVVGAVTFEPGAAGESAARQPLELAGPVSNSYRGPTVLARGRLTLNKPPGVVAIPGDLSVGETAPANAGDAMILAADGQIASKATVTLHGKSQPCFLDQDRQPQRTRRRPDCQSSHRQRRQQAGRNLHRRHREVDRRNRPRGRGTVRRSSVAGHPLFREASCASSYFKSFAPLSLAMRLSFVRTRTPRSK